MRVWDIPHFSIGFLQLLKENMNCCVKTTHFSSIIAENELKPQLLQKDVDVVA